MTIKRSDYSYSPPWGFWSLLFRIRSELGSATDSEERDVMQLTLLTWTGSKLTVICWFWVVDVSSFCVRSVASQQVYAPPLTPHPPL